MKYTVTKLDRRHSRHDEFDWMIEFKRPKSYISKTKSGVLEFDQCRRWFNEKFGWSQDAETRSEIIQTTENKDPDAYNSIWSWSVRYAEYRIYIKDDAILNWFTLTFPKIYNDEPLF